MPQCKFCSYQCKTNSNLSKHINKHHPEHKNDSKTCPHCQKVFSSNVNCKHHMDKQVCQRIDEVFGITEEPVIVEPIVEESIIKEAIVEEPVIITPLKPKWISTLKTFTSVIVLTIAVKLLFKKIKR